MRYNPAYEQQQVPEREDVHEKEDAVEDTLELDRDAGFEKTEVPENLDNDVSARGGGQRRPLGDGRGGRQAKFGFPFVQKRTIFTGMGGTGERKDKTDSILLQLQKDHEEATGEPGHINAGPGARGEWINPYKLVVGEPDDKLLIENADRIEMYLSTNPEGTVVIAGNSRGCFDALNLCIELDDRGVNVNELILNSPVAACPKPGDRNLWHPKKGEFVTVSDLDIEIPDRVEKCLIFRQTEDPRPSFKEGSFKPDERVQEYVVPGTRHGDVLGGSEDAKKLQLDVVTKQSGGLFERPLLPKDEWYDTWRRLRKRSVEDYTTWSDKATNVGNTAGSFLLGSKNERAIPPEGTPVLPSYAGDIPTSERAKALRKRDEKLGENVQDEVPKALDELLEVYEKNKPEE